MNPTFTITLSITDDGVVYADLGGNLICLSDDLGGLAAQDLYGVVYAVDSYLRSDAD